MSLHLFERERERDANELGFNEFISEREYCDPKVKKKDPRMVLFDEIVLSKRNRGHSSLFSKRTTTDFLSDTSNHLWRTASAASVGASSSNSISRSQQSLSDDYSRVVSRSKFISTGCMLIN